MENIWGNFWKKSNVEWTQRDVLDSRSLKEILCSLKYYFKKNNLKGLDLIEVGAGTGITSYFFAKHGAKITLLDREKEAKKQAEKWWNGFKYNYIIMDLLNYNNKKFDIVSSFGLCEHFSGKKRKKVLKKHINLLKNKGVAIISVPYKYGVFYRIEKFLAEIFGLWSFGEEFPFSKNELIRFAKENNFDYEVKIGGFYSSGYDLFIKKPLKLFNIKLRRRFDNKKSLFDFLGSSIIIILKKRAD